jgi:hypothetical protein
MQIIKFDGRIAPNTARVLEENTQNLARQMASHRLTVAQAEVLYYGACMHDYADLGDLDGAMKCFDNMLRARNAAKGIMEAFPELKL